MENNINLRNQYIKKVQDRVNKLLYSINLLDNLNEVISQKGGANDAGIQDSLLNSFKAKQTEDIKKMNEIDEINKTRKSLFMNSNMKISILETKIKNLTNELIDKNNTLQNTGSQSQLELDAEKEKLRTATEELAKLKVDNEKCNADKIELSAILTSYSQKLNEIAANIPSDNTIEEINQEVDDIITIIEQMPGDKNVRDENNLFSKANVSINPDTLKLIKEIYELLNKGQPDNRSIGYELKELLAREIKFEQSSTNSSSTEFKYDKTKGYEKISNFSKLKIEGVYKNIMTFIGIIGNMVVYLHDPINNKDQIAECIVKLNELKAVLESSTPK
jgi:hypothetical protein